MLKSLNNMDKQTLIEVLKDLSKKTSKLSTGNVSHQKANIQSGLNGIIYYLENSDKIQDKTELSDVFKQDNCYNSYIKEINENIKNNLLTKNTYYDH